MKVQFSRNELRAAKRLAYVVAREIDDEVAGKILAQYLYEGMEDAPFVSIVLVIDQDCVAPVEAERQAPVAIHRHREVARQVALQRMQAPARQVHVLGSLRRVQARQLAGQFRRVVRLNADLAPRLEEGLKPFVLETLNHV